MNWNFTGPEKELLQLSVFSELQALFPNVDVHIELVGPSIPQHRYVLHFDALHGIPLHLLLVLAASCGEHLKIISHLKWILLVLFEKDRDGEMIELCNYAHCLDKDCTCKSTSETANGVVHTSKPSAVTLHLRSGFYHDRYRDMTKVGYFLSLSMDINIHAIRIILF